MVTGCLPVFTTPDLWSLSVYIGGGVGGGGGGGTPKAMNSLPGKLWIFPLGFWKCWGAGIGYLWEKPGDGLPGQGFWTPGPPPKGLGGPNGGLGTFIMGPGSVRGMCPIGTEEGGSIGGSITRGTPLGGPSERPWKCIASWGKGPM